jgi:type VI secretion system protein ImpG
MKSRSINKHEIEQRAYFDDALRRYTERLGPCDTSARVLGQAIASCMAHVLHRFDAAWDDARRAILAAVDPHALSVVPARCVVAFSPRARSGLVPRGAVLRRADAASAAADADSPIEFRTTRDTPVWPVAVRDLVVKADELAFQLTLTDPDPEASLASLVGLDHLELYAAGDAPAALALIDALTEAQVVTAATADGDHRTTLEVHVVEPDGGEDGFLPPAHGRSEFDRRLAEFLLFPESRLYIALSKLAPALSSAGRSITVSARLDPSRPRLRGRWADAQLVANCAPVVNLFEESVALAVKPYRDTTPITPLDEGDREIEVAAVLEVTERGESLGPIHAMRHPYRGPSSPATSWQTVVRSAHGPGGVGFETGLRLVDRGPAAAAPTERRLNIQMLGCQGDRPCARLIAEWRTVADGLSARSVSPIHPPLRPPAHELAERSAAHHIASRSALRRLGRIPSGDGAIALRTLLHHIGHFNWEASPALEAEAHRLRSGVAGMIDAIESVDASRDPDNTAGWPRRLISIGMNPALPTISGRGVFARLLSRLFCDLDGFGAPDRVEIGPVSSEGSRRGEQTIRDRFFEVLT